MNSTNSEFYFFSAVYTEWLALIYWATLIQAGEYFMQW